MDGGAVAFFYIKEKVCHFSFVRSLGLRRKRNGWGSAGIELSGIPVEYTGIKPGVRPPFLFRLDTTRRAAIWHSVRQTKHSPYTTVLTWNRECTYLYIYKVPQNLPSGSHVDVSSQKLCHFIGNCFGWELNACWHASDVTSDVNM